MKQWREDDEGEIVERDEIVSILSDGTPADAKRVTRFKEEMTLVDLLSFLYMNEAENHFVRFQDYIFFNMRREKTRELLYLPLL